MESINEHVVILPEYEMFRQRFIKAAMNIPVIEPGIRKACIILSNCGTIPVWSCEGHPMTEESNGNSPYISIASNDTGLIMLDRVIADLLIQPNLYWEVEISRAVYPWVETDAPTVKETYPVWVLRAKYAYTEEQIIEARAQLLSVVESAAGK